MSPCRKTSFMYVLGRTFAFARTEQPTTIRRFIGDVRFASHETWDVIGWNVESGKDGFKTYSASPWFVVATILRIILTRPASVLMSGRFRRFRL